MTNKKRTVSRRYNQKKRYKQKKLTNKKKRGGAAAAFFSQGQPSQGEETVELDKLVIRLVLSQEAGRHEPDELKKYLKSYLKKDLFKIFKNGAWFENVTIDHTSNRRFFVQIPKDQWTQKTYQKYKEHVEELFNTIKLGRPGGMLPIHFINDEKSIFIQEMTIDETWIKEAKERIIMKQRREQALIDARRQEREEEEERAREREREAAAVKIQSGFRGSQGRDVASEERVKRDREDAILQIQKMRRGKLGRNIAEKAKKEKRIITEVQAKFRGKRARGEAQAMKDATLRVQGAFRAKKAKKEKEEQIKKIKGVQAKFRGDKERRILSRRIFWTDEKGEINTKKTVVEEGDYSDVVRESLGREETGIPILLQIGDEVKVRLLNFPTNTNPWNTGKVIRTNPNIEVRVKEKSIEVWPIVRKDDSIKKYIEELQGLISLVNSNEERLKIRERINRGRILLNEDVDCNFGEGDEGKCNLNPKCRYVSGNYGELKSGNCLTKEEIIEELKPVIQTLEEDAVRIPSVETYDNNIKTYKELRKILKDTMYDEKINQIEQMRNTLLDKKLKEGEAKVKRERREERKEEILQRMNEGRKALGEIKDRFLADEKRKFKQLKKSLTKKKKPKKKIDRVITETKVDLRDKTVNYTLKQKKNKKPIHDVKKDYMKFVDDYYNTAIQKDKIIINRFVK